MKQNLLASWYSPNWLTILLLPISYLFCCLVVLRRYLYRLGMLRVTSLSVPVIIVGNINVGGSGKTPLLISIVSYLKSLGYSPGVVSRGYGGEIGQQIVAVTPQSEASVVGDEPLQIALRCDCPVVVGVDRVAAAKKIVHEFHCDVVISDDGLQRYALGRDIEIAVIDARRRLGNRKCLPAGPLREPPSRLKQVDFVVINGGEAKASEYSMKLVMRTAKQLAKLKSTDSDEETKLELQHQFEGQTVHAVAGIGDPNRFFDALRDHGIQCIEHAFDDHHRYRPEQLAFQDEYAVLMTEKDAVKCMAFSKPHYWFVPVDAVVDTAFYQQLSLRLEEIKRHGQ